MAAPGASAVRNPHSGGANHSVDSGLSGHVGSVAPAGPSAALLEDHSSEENSHRVSQVSAALSGEVRNAASAAFSSRSIEGESALSHNVEACSHSQVEYGRMRRRLGSVEEMSGRSCDGRAGPSHPSMPCQPCQGQSTIRDTMSRRVRYLENGGSASHHTIRQPQFSLPSNVAVEHSSRGGGLSISQVVQGQNFQASVEWDVEVAWNSIMDHVSPGPAGSSGNLQQASGPMHAPSLAIISGNQRQPCGSEEPGGHVENQTSASVSQRVRPDSISDPIQRFLMGDHVASPVEAQPRDRQSLRQSIKAVMRRTFNNVRGTEAVQASLSRNSAGVPPNFALPDPPLPAQGAEQCVGENHANSCVRNQASRSRIRRDGASLTANSGGGMVGSAYGGAIPDDMVSDADTNLSFLRRRREQAEENDQPSAAVSAPMSGRLESDPSASHDHRPTATVHTVVGSVEVGLLAEQANMAGNNSTVNRQGSYQSGNTSTVNMSNKEIKNEKVEDKMEEDIDDTAHSGRSSGRSSSESPKSVTGLRQAGLSTNSNRSPFSTKGDVSEESCGPEAAEMSGRTAHSHQSQSTENRGHHGSQAKSNTGSERGTGKSRKRKQPPSDIGSSQRSKR